MYSYSFQHYAQAMCKLATEYWERNANDDQNKGAVSRVQWVVQHCENYYFSGGLKNAFAKEISLCHRFNLKTGDILEPNSPTQLRVLDVGSCYNPFQGYSRFEVVAIDIAPASRDVHQCDFLNVEILEKGGWSQNVTGRITDLTKESFDVVVFSLLLEYLPSSKQRYTCCSNASKLLAPGGILCVITPDSKHASANSRIMKKWKFALAHAGLLRIEYEKLPHLHCMVFRKCCHPDLAVQWLNSSLVAENRKGTSFSDSPDQLMVIPQDFNYYSENDSDADAVDVRDDDETIASAFADLPEL